MLVLNQVIGYSQTETLTQETIKQLSNEQKRMFEMFSNGDTETFLKITGDDYLAINADGTYMNKTQSVELIPKFKGSTYDILEQTDRIYGNVAISTGRAKFYLSSILVADVYFNQTWIYRDDIKRLKDFQPPVLLVRGTGSTKWLHHIIDGLSETIPHARVVEFPGGHAPHIVSTDKFISALEKFQSDSVK